MATAITSAIFATAPAHASSGGEAEFVSKINAERRERGLGTLDTRSDLTAIARRHSARMAEEGSIWHNDNLGNEVDGNWTVLGENVGMGPSVDSLHEAFMNSKDHRDNILYSPFNQIGVGIVKKDGTIYVTEVFARRTSGGSSGGGGSSDGGSGSSSGSSDDSYTAQAPSVTSVPAPAPKREPAPEAEPVTVDLLKRVLGLDADSVDPVSGSALVGSRR